MTTDPDVAAFDYGLIHRDLLRIAQHLKQHPLPDGQDSTSDSLALAIAMVARLGELATGFGEDALNAPAPVGDCLAADR